MDFKKFDRETYEKIDRYIRNQMSEEDAVDFEIKISLDKKLENSVKLRRLMVDSIQFRRKEELKHFIKRNSGIRFSGNIWGKHFTRFSAFLIIITGLLIWFTDPEDPRHNPDKTDPIMSAPDEENEDTLDLN